eukprot:6086833-Karenia_brevis.AAC.1
MTVLKSLQKQTAAYICRTCDDDVINESPAQAQTATWLTVCGSTHVADTYRGTQPGRQLADLLFQHEFCAYHSRS